MKILEHYLEKTSGESKIHLDLDGNLCIVYITKDGLQLLDPPNKQLETEEAHSIIKFIEDYLNTISEDLTIKNESTEHTRSLSENQTTNIGGEIPSSQSQADSKSSPEAEGRGESSGLGQTS